MICRETNGEVRVREEREEEDRGRKMRIEGDREKEEEREAERESHVSLIPEQERKPRLGRVSQELDEASCSRNMSE